MAKIEFITADDVSYVSVGELVKRSDFSGTAGSVPANARSESEMATYFEGSEERPQLVEVRRAPNSVAEPHADGRDEIIFVLEGELRFGARGVRPWERRPNSGPYALRVRGRAAGLSVPQLSPGQGHGVPDEERACWRTNQVGRLRARDHSRGSATDPRTRALQFCGQTGSRTRPPPRHAAAASAAASTVCPPDHLVVSLGRERPTLTARTAACSSAWTRHGPSSSSAPWPWPQAVELPAHIYARDRTRSRRYLGPDVLDPSKLLDPWRAV